MLLLPLNFSSKTSNDVAMRSTDFFLCLNLFTTFIRYLPQHIQFLSERSSLPLWTNFHFVDSGAYSDNSNRLSQAKSPSQFRDFSVDPWQAFFPTQYSIKNEDSFERSYSSGTIPFSRVPREFPFLIVPQGMIPLFFFVGTFNLRN